MHKKLLGGLIALLTLFYFHPSLAQVRRSDVPAGMFLAKSDYFDSYNKRKNGPAQEGLATGTGRWQENSNIGRANPALCIMNPGLGAEAWIDSISVCNPGGGYPAGGQVSNANGVTTIQMEPTPSTLTASLPTDATYGYGNFSGTCSATASTDMVCTAVTTNNLKSGATITGTGVTAGTKIVAYGSGATLTTGCTVTCHYTLSVSQTFGSTTVTSTRAWPYVSAQLNSYQWFNFKPDKGFCYRVHASVPSGTGAWTAIWTYSANDSFNLTTGAFDAVSKSEIDHLEHFNASGNTSVTSNFHYNTSPGGTYFSTNTDTKARFIVEDGYHWYEACGDLKHVVYKVDKTVVADVAIPSSALGWANTWQYFIFDLAAGNSDAAFEGVYTSATTQLKIDSWEFYIRNDAKTCSSRTTTPCDVMINETGDGTGLGPELVLDNALYHNQYPNSHFPVCVDVTTATMVDSLPGEAIKVAVNGGDPACMDFHYGASPVAALVSGHTYNVIVDYDYVGANASLAARFGIGHSTANDEVFTFSGTTATVASGSGCASPTITTVSSHKHFTCLFTAPASGDSFWTFGPNSATNTKDVTLYQVSIRDTVPRT